MPDTALTTRVTEETYQRLKIEAVYRRQTIQEIVEAALRAYLGISSPQPEVDARD